MTSGLPPAGPPPEPPRGSWSGQVHQGTVTTGPRPYGQSFGSGQRYNSAPRQQPTTSAGRVLGIVAVPVAVPLGPLGVVLGLISYTKARRGNGPTGWGVAAMIVGALSTLLLTLVILVLVTAGLATMTEAPGGGGPRTGTVPVGSLAVGECALDLDVSAGVAELADCREWHQGEAFAEVEVGGGDYPGADELFDVAGDECLRLAGELVPGGVDASGVGVGAIVPDERAWDEGLTSARCVAVDTSGRNMAGSIAAGTLRTR